MMHRTGLVRILEQYEYFSENLFLYNKLNYFYGPILLSTIPESHEINPFVTFLYPLTISNSSTRPISTCQFGIDPHYEKNLEKSTNSKLITMP